MYELDKNKKHKSLKDKKSVTQEQRKKETNPLVNRSGDFHKLLDLDKRPPVRCWNCNENHYARDFPHKKGDKIHNIQEAILGDAGKT